MIEQILNNTFAQLGNLSVPVLFASAILLVCVWLSRRDHRRIVKLQRELQQARSDLKALTATSLGVGGRVLDIERRVRKIKQQAQPASQAKPQVVLHEAANQPYDHAAYLVAQGRAIEDVAATCGISRNEAELIAMMQRLEKAS